MNRTYSYPNESVFDFGVEKVDVLVLWMRDGLFNGHSALNRINDGGEHGEDHASVDKEDAERHRTPVKTRKRRKRGGQQVPAIDDGDAQQHE